MIIPYYCEDYPEELPPPHSSGDRDREKDEKRAEKKTAKEDCDGSRVKGRCRDKKAQPTLVASPLTK